MVWTVPVDLSDLPPRLAVRPELTDEDVRWLNSHLELVDRPAVKYSRQGPPTPPPSGGVLVEN